MFRLAAFCSAIVRRIAAAGKPLADSRCAEGRQGTLPVMDTLVTELHIRIGELEEQRTAENASQLDEEKVRIRESIDTILGPVAIHPAFR